jgi:hypothetical protein
MYRDIREIGNAGLFGDELQHRGGDISRQDEARRSDPPGRCACLVARAGGDVDHAATRGHAGAIQQHLGRRRKHAITDVFPLYPTRGDTVPLAKCLGVFHPDASLCPMLPKSTAALGWHQDSRASVETELG